MKTDKFLLLLLLLFIFCQPTAKTAEQTSPNFVFPYEISCYPASRVVFRSKTYMFSKIITYFVFSMTQEAIKDRRKFGSMSSSKTACSEAIID